MTANRRRRLGWLIAGSAAVLVSAAAPWLPPDTGSWGVVTLTVGEPEPTAAPAFETAPTAQPTVTRTPTPPEPFEYAVDETGRPYDMELPPETAIDRVLVGQLTAPKGRFDIGAGEYIFIDGTETFPLTPTAADAYDVTVVYASSRVQSATGQASTRPWPASIVVAAPGAEVARWGSEDRDGYLTDGGMGGIAASVWLPPTAAADGSATEVAPVEKEDEHRQAVMDEFLGRDYVLVDNSGDGLDETVIFGNSVGDGWYPVIVGYDYDGRAVALASWSYTLPWRVAFPQGSPPPEVAAREDAVIGCRDAGQRAAWDYDGPPLSITCLP